MKTTDSNSLAADLKGLASKHFPELSQSLAGVLSAPATTACAVTEPVDFGFDDEDGEWQDFSWQSVGSGLLATHLKSGWKTSLDSLGVKSFDGLLAVLVGQVATQRQQRHDAPLAGEYIT